MVPPRGTECEQGQTPALASGLRPRKFNCAYVDIEKGKKQSLDCRRGLKGQDN